MCHRLKHQVSDERGADLIRTTFPEDHRNTHTTEEHCPDKQLSVWLLLVLCDESGTTNESHYNLLPIYTFV